MTHLQFLRFDQLARIYLVSNTPSYLYRHFKADSTVQDLARLNSPLDLASTLGEIAAIDPNERTLRQIVSAYASIVALTFKQPREVFDAVADIRLSSIVWGDKILNLWNASETTTQVTEVVVPPKIVTPTPTSTRTNVVTRN